MTKLTYVLVLCALMLLLGITPLFRGSRRQKQYQKEGMRILTVARGRIVLPPALACFCTGFVGFFVILMWQDMGVSALAEEFWFWVLLGTVVLLDVVCFLAGYVLQRRHILYNEEMFLIGRPFRDYQKLHWYEISKMQIKNQDFFNLYDREGRRCAQASAVLEGYQAFYQEALLRVKSEQDVAAGEGNAYTKRFTPTNGSGILQPREGEYVVLLVLMGAIILVTAGIGMQGGIGAGELLAGFLEERLYGALIVPIGFVVGLQGLIWALGSKITYDRTEIVWYRFGRKRKSLRRADITGITVKEERNGLRKLVFYTKTKQYRIRETQYRKGFSEFFAELRGEFQKAEDLYGNNG